MRKLKIKFERGGEIAATLLEKKAPKTSEMLWNQLPLESLVTHSRWSGREINLSCPEVQPLFRENQTIYTSIG
ncbi:DUF3830 family protein [Neobacillus cucumis]|uniref:DUF3830 family protein n=1 Tax=Neobacillus cucumis TaxID=1740721 RepID=UPI002570ABEF|nr:DUF3830 family protein [Neobacillus cucumis]